MLASRFCKPLGASVFIITTLLALFLHHATWNTASLVPHALDLGVLFTPFATEIPDTAESALHLDNLTTLSLPTIRSMQWRPGVDIIYEPKFWIDFVCKGARLVNMMKAPDINAAQAANGAQKTASDWPNPSEQDVLSSGWTVSDDESAPDFKHPTYAQMLAALGISSFQARSIEFTYDHYRQTEDRRKRAKEYSSHYVNIIHQGLLVAENNFSPAAAAAAATVPVGQPPMSRWSDFMAYQWQADAVQQALDPQGLKAVLQSDVVNGQSQDTIKYALQLTDQIIQYWDSGAEHKPARFTLEQNPEAFHALIACPNGRGVAWLLTQHKETFGVREIWAIDVFHVLEEGVGEEGSEWKVERDPKDPNGYDMNNNNQLEMLFYIRPVQGTPLSQPGSPGAESPAAEPPSQPGSPGVEPPAAEPPSQPRSPGVQSPAAEPPSQPGSPGVQSPAAEPPSSLPFKSDSEDRALGLQRAKSRRSVQVVEKPTFWQEFVCKGDRYIAMMAAPDLATAGTASGHGNVASAYPNLDDATIINSGWTINTFGADIDLRLSGYEAMCKAIGLRPEFAYGVSYIYGDLEKGYFTNVVSQGTIFAEANLSPSNKGPQLASTSLPQRWADFVHHQWMNDATQQALDPRGLNYVLQDGVMNVQTRDCLIYAMQQTGQAIKFWTPGKPPPVWFTLTDTPEPFKALLASPNGRGAAWLLTQHKDTFGVREIWGITAFHALKYDFLEPDPYDREGMDMNRWDNSLQILFHIRPVAPRDSVQQVRSRRSVQVIPEPPWWVDYVCQGAKFMAMMAAPDLATAAKVGGRDSVESDYPDLDEKTILDIGWAINTMAATINLELPGFKPMLQKLGLKAKKVTGETFQRKANVSWPTRAYFMNAIYQGMLIGLNNQSPATLPQAAGSPPALRQSWSDFVHYQWKKDKDQQALDPKGLKYVLRHHVINERTRDAVQYAMQQTKQVVQYWNRGGSPARLTPEDTPEEFKAMLATPNGHGIPWLLTQHKDTFGVREVYAIEIFHVYEALFNGDEPPSDDPMGRDFTEEWLNKLEILFYIREVSSPGAPAKAPAKAPADVQLKAKL